MWDREVFGWTTEHIQKLEEQVTLLEENLQDGFSEDTDLDLLVTKMELNTRLNREETKLAQQAK